MGKSMGKYESELNLKATELRLGLPGRDDAEESSCTSNSVRCNKRSSPESSEEEFVNKIDHEQDSAARQPAKVQVVGWPPVRSYRKNVLAAEDENGDGCGKYVKVRMAGAAYLRKIDLKVYKNYPELLMALESMFKCSFGEYSEREGYINGSEYAPTYEDKDGDWMLVGDVPWDMFMCSCKRLRIVKGSEAKGLGCL